MPDHVPVKETDAARKKERELRLLERIAGLLLREHLITPKEQIHFLANLKKEE